MLRMAVEKDLFNKISYLIRLIPKVIRNVGIAPPALVFNGGKDEAIRIEFGFDQYPGRLRVFGRFRERLCSLCTLNNPVKEKPYPFALGSGFEDVGDVNGNGSALVSVHDLLVSEQALRRAVVALQEA